MAFETSAAALAFLVGRLLFGGVLAFMGLNHFQQREEMAGYAEFKGVPAPNVMVPLTGVVLVLGGLSVIVGAYVAVGAVLLAAFLLASAVLMHDFWAASGEDQQTEMTQFLKNVALAGGALALVAVAGSNWPYALGYGLF
ncbi:MAG: DoxX family protein [Haloarculaceae archaeon]